MHSVCCVFAFDISIKQIFKETFVDEEASTIEHFLRHYIGKHSFSSEHWYMYE